MSRTFLQAQANAERGLSVFMRPFQAKREHDPSSVAWFFDDFLPAPYLAATGTQGNWYGYLDGANLIEAPTATDISKGEAGLVRLYNDGTDNDSPAMTLASGNKGAPFVISDTAGSTFKLGFECRFKVDTVADDVTAIFLGMGEEGIPADNCKVDDTGVMVDKDWIGFDSVHVNGGTAGTNAILTFKYNVASGASSPVTVISSLQTMVASTWYKVGFLFDPAEDTAKRIKIFLDGVEQNTYVTGTNIATAAAFPDGEEITPVFISKAGAATASNLTLDWVCAAQLFEENY